MGHYRFFIKDFTKIADPLHEYVRGDTTKKKKERVVLNEAARDVFHKLEKAVMSAPILAYPDPNKEYLLKTDASKLGLGAVLSQKHADGRYQCSSIEHFQTYLLRRCFKVHTDNSPLTCFLTSPYIDATKQRWINELVKYDFSLEYQKGKNNMVADALSRIEEAHLSDEKAEKVLKAAPVMPGDDTIFEVFKEKEEDRWPEKAGPHTMSSEAMKAVFDDFRS